MISFQKEQIYIVTGASSGIGEGVALLLNELGATVIAIARNEKRLNEMKAKSKFPENIHLEKKDLAENIAGLPQYVKELKNKYGKFSGMAYCAGVTGVNPLQLLEYETMKEIFDINYFAPIFMTKGIADRRNNVGKGASLVFLSSVDAELSSKGQPTYSGTKAALSASIKAISREISSFGMRANCVLPSMIKTPMVINPTYVTTAIENLEEYPFGWGEVDDVANLVIYLLSDKAKYISGQNYIVDSGGVI